jgi:hypothetical protein
MGTYLRLWDMATLKMAAASAFCANAQNLREALRRGQASLSVWPAPENRQVTASQHPH